jgi:putative ABC transport system permease protein
MQSLETVASALLALSLVAAAIAISRYQRLDLERDIATTVVRSFVQLTAVGYAIDLIFGLDSLLYVFLLLAGMVTFASWTSAGRGEGVSGAYAISAVAIGVAAAATLGVLLLLQIVPPTARYLIPLGGMVIGNSMNTASLTLGRVRDDVNTHRLNIESALALGATSRQAVSPILRTALRSAMTP